MAFHHHLLSALLLVSSFSFADEPGRYDDGARWAFITDQTSNQVAVVDTFEHAHVDTLSMQVIPTMMEVSDVQDMLLYIDGKTTKVYVYDLVEKNTGA